MAAKSVKKDVMAKLGSVTDDQLEEILTDLDLTVTVERRKKENAVFNAIGRHLSSEEVEDLEDEGLSILLKVQTKLTEMLEEEDKKDDTTKTEGGNTDATADSKSKTASVETVLMKEPEVVVKDEKPSTKGAAAQVTRVEYHRLKDFRIEGGTVNGTLSYRNVCFQMEKGLSLIHI